MKVIAIIEKPENCLYCDMLNGSDERSKEFERVLNILSKYE